MVSPSVIGGVFITILISFPLIFSAFFCNLFFLLVLICINSRNCFHRDFGLSYLTFVLISLVTDNLLSGILVRGLPWMNKAAIEMTMTSHKACKYYSFLNAFLSATRANLLLAHCLLHVFTIELHTERRSTTFSIVALNVLCVLVGAFMAVSAATVHGIWVIGSRLVCLPDPEWPQLLVLFYMIHKALFCDAIVQAVVILVACFQLREMSNRLERIISCLLFTTDSKFLLYASLRRLREKNLRIQECLRVVYVHATFIAVTMIVKGIITLAMTDRIYGSQRHTVYASSVLENLLTFLTFHDLLNDCEAVGNLMHAWTAFFWQSTMRNTFLQFFMHLFRPFKRLRGWIHSFFYTDTITDARKSEKGRKSLAFEKNFLRYAGLIASRLTDENLREALAWLLNVPNLPREMKDFIEECGVLKQER
ncbi:unnamed protein product [Taenia asiatica]|uniref:G_PROTEIN_RECEP_F1_2 domain-containing protein n=1 Tax=Taenia asiatica TaxID=60517 RepID=A0A0R3VVF7_TAEAS|nr:unnamed protein product [Taenia asiatica]